MAQVFKNINIDDLKLDLMNPRLPKSKQGLDEKTVIEYMMLEAATLELMMAIGQNDYFAGEQLLVVEDEEDEGKYVVVEGNRRLTAVKLLNDPSISTVKKDSIKKAQAEAIFKPQEIPCLVFDEKNEILKYLGFRHITGIKSWRLLEKARYLSDLKSREFESVGFLLACREIAKMIGSSSSYTRRLLTGFSIYKLVEDEGFYEIDNLNDTRFHLNYFVDALNKENIRNFLKVDFNIEDPIKHLDENNLKLLTHWWFEKTEGRSRVIGDSEGLKMLDAVIGNAISLKAFRDDGATIEDAYDLTGEIDLLFKKEVESALTSLERADSYSNKVDDFYAGIYEDLKGIREIALKIRNYQLQKESQEDDF